MLNYTNRRFLLFSCLFLPDIQYLCSPKGKIKRAGHDRITTQNNALNLLSTEDFFMTDDKKLSVADLEERLLYDDDDDAASGIDMSKRKHVYYYGYGFYGRYGRYAYSHYANNNDKSIKR